MADWQEQVLGELFEVQLGKMLDANSGHGFQYPYLANRNVQWGRVVVDNDLKTMHFSETERDRYRLRSGDLLVCEGGEVGRAALWSDELPECYFQNAIHRLRPKVGVDARFMRQYFEFAAAHGRLRALTGQTSIGHLPRANLVRWTVPLPSMEEQFRITEILDTVEETIQTTDRLIAKLRMQLCGVKHDLLLARHDWKRGPVYRLLAVIESGKSPVAGERSPGPAEWGVLKVSAVHPEGFRPHEAKVVSSSLVRKRDQVHDGDILMTRANTTRLVGACCYVEDPPPRLQLSDKTLRLVPNSKVRPMFLALLLQSPNVRAQIERDGTGTSGGMKNISQTEIRSLIVSWPDLQTQDQILASLAVTTSQLRTELKSLKKLQEIRSGLAADLLSGRVRTGEA